MLGTRIASLRHEAGLSQSELAHRLNISPSSIGMYEQGRRQPPISTLIALSKEFSVSIDYLLTGYTALSAISTTKQSRCTLSRDDLAILIAALLTESK